jgi:ABC-type polysaccharide/polyol phosphate transport system ATPase subunit
MSQPAIIVEGISKRYRLGHANAKHQTFREMAMGLAAAPFRKLRSAHEGGNQGEEFWALKDVNFEVQPGEVVGIIGRNGAGKSTLLKILSRITEPTTGQIRLRGRVASLLEVGTGFHPELTGRENIYLNGAILGMKRAEITKKFDEIVAFAETEKFLDTPVKFYSSGMYVRLAFAVAAHLEPEILIVDEVLAVGDAEFQKKCLGKMKEVSQGGGRTVLFVSHNMLAISSLCDKGLLMQGGNLMMNSNIHDVVEAYRQLSTSNHVAGGHVLTETSKLKWIGLPNNRSPLRMQLGDNLDLAFEFQVGSTPIDNVNFDCAVVNDAGQMVIHAKSKVVSRPFKLASNERFLVTYRFIEPRLVPGIYTFIIFAKAGSEVLYWAEGVPGLQVEAKLDFGEVLAMDEFKGQMVPRYSLELLHGD